MKTKIVICAILAGTSLALAGCSEQPSEKVNVYMPDGAPAIALAKLMHEGYDGAQFSVVPNAAKVTIAQHVAKGDADLAILPINAAATLYNKGTEIVMLTVNTHGNLYVLGDGQAASFADFAGKRIAVIGQANVPEYTLKMLLNENGVEFADSESAVDGKAALRYVGAGNEVAQLFSKGDIDYGFVAEPAASTLAANANLNKSIVMDVQAQWKAAFGDDFPQACLVANKSFLDSHAEYVKGFIDALKASDGWAEENPDKALSAVKEHMEEGTQSALTALTADMVKNCNIKTVSASSSKDSCAKYFNKLKDMSTVLGAALDKLPDDDFYYKG